MMLGNWWKLSWVALLPLAAARSVANGAPAAPQAPLTAEYLRCEYRVDPLGIDETHPRLSWRLKSTERGQGQTAYQVLVSRYLSLTVWSKAETRGIPAKSPVTRRPRLSTKGRH